MIVKLSVFCVFSFLFSAAADKVHHLTAWPETILEGLTTDFTLRCSVGDAAPSVNSVLLIQMEKLSGNGHQVPLATIHDGGTPVRPGDGCHYGQTLLKDAKNGRLHSVPFLWQPSLVGTGTGPRTVVWNGGITQLDLPELTSRAVVTGSIDKHNVSASFLQVDLDSPHSSDSGEYVCVIMVLDTTNLLTQLADHIDVNSTQATTTNELRHALSQLIQEVEALKSGNTALSGNCSCGGSSGQVSQLHSDIQTLKTFTEDQADLIQQLSGKVASLESQMAGSTAANHSSAKPDTDKPLGFVAVGPAGSVYYTSTIYNTDNRSFSVKSEHFTAPHPGFYFFHAYDSQPSHPLLGLYLNDRPMVHSAKAITLREGNVTAHLSPLSVSGMVHLQAGDVVSTRYVSNTQSFGASFSGARILATDSD